MEDVLRRRDGGAVAGPTGSADLAGRSKATCSFLVTRSLGKATSAPSQLSLQDIGAFLKLSDDQWGKIGTDLKKGASFTEDGKRS